MTVDLSNKEVAYISGLLKERSKVNSDLLRKFMTVKDRKFELQKAINTMNLLTKWEFDHALKEGNTESAHEMIKTALAGKKIMDDWAELLEALIAKGEDPDRSATAEKCVEINHEVHQVDGKTVYKVNGHYFEIIYHCEPIPITAAMLTEMYNVADLEKKEENKSFLDNAIPFEIWSEEAYVGW